ncbi:hypothetical protein VULLAG_LOCUS14957 [Vulpes lagopus]
MRSFWRPITKRPRLPQGWNRCGSHGASPSGAVCRRFPLRQGLPSAAGAHFTCVHLCAGSAWKSQPRRAALSQLQGSKHSILCPQRPAAGLASHAYAVFAQPPSLGCPMPHAWSPLRRSPHLQAPSGEHSPWQRAKPHCVPKPQGRNKYSAARGKSPACFNPAVLPSKPRSSWVEGRGSCVMGTKEGT